MKTAGSLPYRIFKKDFLDAFDKVCLHFELTEKQRHFARQQARDKQAKAIYIAIAKSL